MRPGAEGPRRLRPAALALAVALAPACAEATGEVRGGELTPAGAAATTPMPFDAGSTSAPPVCQGSGTRWSDLYRDVFGPTGQPGSCSFRSSCHGSPGAAGALAAGVVCADEKGCRASFLENNLVVVPKDSAAPEKSILLGGLLRLRRPDGTVIGFMPAAPADYVFPDECVERIKTWIVNGAPDD